MAENLSRRRFLQGGTALTAMGALHALAESLPTRSVKAPTTMPAIFVGHGSPINAIQNNVFTRHLGQWGKALPRPQAILVVSAHWLSDHITLVGAQLHPRTIYDFGGFPPALYEISYPARGAPQLAHSTVATVHTTVVAESGAWGLDHGAWTILHHMYPKADIPVFQLSIDITQPAAFHYAIGKDLAVLRDMGVLVVGSGNIVHNLADTDDSMSPDDTHPTRRWARNFDEAVARSLAGRDDKSLLDYAKLDPEAMTAVPLPDHYFPLLYVLGSTGVREKAVTTYSGFQEGTISMRCLQFG